MTYLFLNPNRSINSISILVSIMLVFIFHGCTQKNDDSTWGAYKADAASTSYSALKQVNKLNVTHLKQAWKFSFQDGLKGSRFAKSECNPIVVNGIMYVTSARRRLYALHANTGQQVWSFDPFNGGPGGGNNRGVTYWEDGTDKRIIFTAGDDIIALNAATGEIITSFGNTGRVSMNVGIRDDPRSISVKASSPGIIYRDLLILGNEMSEAYGAQPGYVRAYNVRSGKLEWTFHTVPLPGEPGYETWPKNAWKFVGGVNCWSGMSVDKKRALVFLSTGSPTYDFYGADRAGKNLYANCIIALDASTGKLKWHFQTVHHDLWDYDLPAPPNLVTVFQNGKNIDAVAQVSKVGFVYLLNRETGESLFPIEERPVPASDVPGEQSWPTQPFPSKPKPYSRQYITENDLSDFSATSKDALTKKFRQLRYEGLFTPPSLKGSLILPGTVGGSEWGGAAYDPQTGILYVKENTSAEIALLKKADPQNQVVKESPYADGMQLYTTYCIGCHKADKKGDEPFYPSLLNIKERMTEEEVLRKIREGGGKMPSFANILLGHESGIVAYLHEQGNTDSSHGNQHPKETGSEKNSVKAMVNSHSRDTTAQFLNVVAYAKFQDSSGLPGVKGPWGTLNAINLNTGEYEWTIPVGNNPQFQKPGGPITGEISLQGPTITAGGLLFLGSPKEKKLQAFDKDTGKLLWEAALPAMGYSNPSSYISDGKQFIALSVMGDEETPAGSIISFSLP